MRTRLQILLLLLLSLPVLAEGPDIELRAPEGWREEVIELPPDFAPGMSWSGWEILKFAPGMFKAEQPDFFSYVFVLKLKDSTPDWEEQLLLYYGGLARAVMEDPDLDISDFEVSLEGRPEARFGTLTWVEPFTTKKPQKLYLECGKIDDHLWFVCVSPKRWEWPIWTTMRQIRIDFQES